MMKLQDFAALRGVTDRAIQKHLKNHETELEGHIERRGPNGTWLDDYAQDYISKLMYRPAPTIVSDTGLLGELEELRAKYMALLEELNTVRKENTTLIGVQARLETAQAAQRLLEESRDDFKAQVNQARQEASQARQEASESRLEAERAQMQAKGLQTQLDRQQAREDALMHRGLVARILNKDV